MKILYKITNFVSRYMAVIAVGVTIFAFFVNNSFTSWVANPSVLGGFINVNHLLMVVMFGMFLSIIEIVIVPIALGLIFNHFLEKIT